VEKGRLLGLDSAETFFHVDGAAQDGSEIFSKALPRSRALNFSVGSSHAPLPCKPVRRRMTDAGRYLGLTMMSGRSPRNTSSLM